MSRHLLCLLFALTVLPITVAQAGVGIFEKTEDIPRLGNIGSTQLVGLVDKGGKLVEQYLITGHGSDIWGTRDQFHFAYRTMTGDWRVSSDVAWVGKPANNWAKVGVMIRASNANASVMYNSIIANYVDNWNTRTCSQMRKATGASAVGDADLAGKLASRVGIQRVLIGGEIPAIEALADFGSGWERIGSLQLAPAIPDAALFGVAVTSHDTWSTATAKVTDVRYERASLVGAAPAIVDLPAGTVKAGFSADGRENGFVIRTIKAVFTDGWGRAEMDKLLDFGCTGPLCLGAGMPVPGAEEGTRISKFVNLRDTAGNGNFGDDESFPGIDPFEQPAKDPAAGDDDNNFATEVLAVMHLTAGMHAIGVNDDDGTIVKIGGIEVGRSGEWKGVSDTNFFFRVEQEGFYTLRARHLEGGGGSALEMFEYVKNADGSWKRVLMGDVANGASPVFVPEPATIALLGLGALALLRRRK
jgi:hypothetical protein